MSGGLHASETGEGGPALVLLHGFGGTHHAWHGVRVALGTHIRTLAYDLPGHGGSLSVSDAIGASAVAKAVLADFGARGIERFHLAGHSFGGAVAVLIALAEPERVLSLTLFAPGGFGPEINAPLLRDYAAATTREALARCLAAMTGSGVPPEPLVERALSMRDAPGQMEALGRLCAIITRDDRQGAIPREKLAALAMPVHVVWGECDAVLPVRQTDVLPAHFQLHLLPNLGHMLPDEVPEAMAEILAEAIRT